MSQLSAQDEAASHKLRRTALLVVCLGAFITPLMLASVNVALPTIARELRMGAIAASWIPLAYLLASAVFLLPFGRLGDMYGRKRMFLSGVTTITLASILASLAPSGTLLILCRALQGMGGAMLFGTGIAILTDVYPPQQRGKALGLAAAAIYLGLTCGPLLGGWVTQQFGWRAVFVFHLPLALLVILLGLTRLRGEWRGRAGQRFDLPGALVYGLSMSALMYGFSQLPGRLGILLIVLGGAGLYVFFRQQKGRPSPLFNVDVFFGNQVFVYSCLAGFIMYTATFSTTFLMGLYLQNIKQLTPQLAGMVMVFQPLLMTLFSPLSGRMSDRHEPRVLASSGMLLTAVGLALLATINPLTPIVFSIIALALVGLGFALFSPSNINAIMGAVTREHLGAAGGTVSAVRVIGQAFSMGLITLIFALTLGPVEFTPQYDDELLSGINLSFMITALVCLLGVYFSLKRGRLHG